MLHGLLGQKGLSSINSNLQLWHLGYKHVNTKDTPKFPVVVAWVNLIRCQILIVSKYEKVPPCHEGNMDVPSKLADPAPTHTPTLKISVALGLDTQYF